MTIDKLTDAMRFLGLFNALVDEDADRWLISTSPEELDAPIELRKSWVEVADAEAIAGMLAYHWLRNRGLWPPAEVR